MKNGIENLARAAALSAALAGCATAPQPMVRFNSVPEFPPYAEHILGPGVLEEPGFWEGSTAGLGTRNYNALDDLYRAIADTRSEADRNCSAVAGGYETADEATINMRQFLSAEAEYLGSTRMSRAYHQMNFRLCERRK